MGRPPMCEVGKTDPDASMQGGRVGADAQIDPYLSSNFRRNIAVANHMYSKGEQIQKEETATKQLGDIANLMHQKGIEQIQKEETAKKQLGGVATLMNRKGKEQIAKKQLGYVAKLMHRKGKEQIQKVKRARKVKVTVRFEGNEPPCPQKVDMTVEVPGATGTGLAHGR